MSHTLPVELQNPIKVLLFQDTPSTVIRLRHSFVLLSILGRYKKEFLVKVTLLNGGRLLFVSAVQEHLRSFQIGLSLSGIRKLLKRMGFKFRKNYDQLCQRKQQASSTGMGQKTPTPHGKLVGALDGGGIFQPHLTESHLKEDGKGVFFWGCKAADGPCFGTTDMDSLVARQCTPNASEVTQDWFSATSFLLETIRD
ncbi:hypothetical protein INT46_002219 [Mucor plumbeus]|uniref:Uncharacterized protein n=1 Tax=Mucor plumbeus TaxID=97098 RepID=A0A8H7V765_9FUNG|nr:hypothetical protein INT46_002219 [Mucor plumbeus]